MTTTSLLTRIGLGAATAATGLLLAATVALSTGGAAASGRHTPAQAPSTGPGSACVFTADTAQHWITATGHLPCVPRPVARGRSLTHP